MAHTQGHESPTSSSFSGECHDEQFEPEDSSFENASVSTIHPINPNVSQPKPSVSPEETLDKLFHTVSTNVVDAHILCQSIRPFAALAVERNPTSTVLHEILAFVDQGIATGETVSSDSMHSNWSCTNGQMNAIVHHLNSNQYLLQEECEPTTRVSPQSGAPVKKLYSTETQEDSNADAEFLKELADLAM
jgi:hypothetical protein